MPRLTRCLILLWLCPASNVQADISTTSVSSQILSLCGTCQVLVLGETHQKPESPVLFMDIVTQLIAQGERVLVGLEVSASQQDALDAVMAGTRTPEGIAHPIIDSPSFQKMLSELSKLYQTHGPFLTVMAIDALDSERVRDAEMAKHIRHHFVAGQFERVVVLVGNLHAIRKMKWAKDAGRKMPYLAERLVDAGLRVATVMQDLDAECDHLRQPTLYPISEQKGLDAVRKSLQVVKSHPEMDAKKTVDGIVVWECRE